jgi:hypothetical protein
MIMGMFGWSYPPGAENDPSAPYNQDDEGDCEDGEDLIHNIRDLAIQCYGHVADVTSERAKAAVEKGVYKYTSCGCTFNDYGTHVLVGGYCEGSDADIAPHSLEYPFSSKAFFEALDAADAAGCEEWNRTHGCEKCWPEGYCGEWEMLEFGNWPINPDCTECGGDGVIL